MPPDDGPETETLEHLHEVSRDFLQRQLDGFHALERKVWRQVAVLGLVLGTFTVSIPSALEALRSGGPIATFVFGSAYVVTFLVGIAGLGCFIQALRYEVLEVGPFPEEGVVQEYGEDPYREVLVAFAKRWTEGYFNNKKAVHRKEWWARQGWATLHVDLGAAAVAVLSYLVIVL